VLISGLPDSFNGGCSDCGGRSSGDTAGVLRVINPNPSISPTIAPTVAGLAGLNYGDFLEIPQLTIQRYRPTAILSFEGNNTMKIMLCC
jgi:hypothetical protein